MNLITYTILVGLGVGFVITTLLTALMNPRACRGCRHDLLRCDATQD